MYENKKIRGIHATRYIMSWVRAGGKFGLHGEGCGAFRSWLRSLDLSEDELNCIWELAMTGKSELEYSAQKFLDSKDTESCFDVFYKD